MTTKTTNFSGLHDKYTKDNKMNCTIDHRNGIRLENRPQKRIKDRESTNALSNTQINDSS